MKLTKAVSLILTIVFAIWILVLGTYAAFFPVYDGWIFTVVMVALMMAFVTAFFSFLPEDGGNS